MLKPVSTGSADEWSSPHAATRPMPKPSTVPNVAIRIDSQRTIERTWLRV